MELAQKNTALLTLDFQKGILDLVPGARRKQILIIHVGLGFSEGHREIAETNPMFIEEGEG